MMIIHELLHHCISQDWIKDLVEGPLRDLLQNLLNDIHFDIPGYLLNLVKF